MDDVHCFDRYLQSNDLFGKFALDRTPRSWCFLETDKKSAGFCSSVEFPPTGKLSSVFSSSVSSRIEYGKRLALPCWSRRIFPGKLYINSSFLSFNDSLKVSQELFEVKFDLLWRGRNVFSRRAFGFCWFFEDFVNFGLRKIVHFSLFFTIFSGQFSKIIIIRFDNKVTKLWLIKSIICNLKKICYEIEIRQN